MWMALADASGNLQTTYTYGPFGQTIVSGASNGNPYQFHGREAEPMTGIFGGGLYYFRARFLDTGLSRFVSRDPAGFQGGGHLYNYGGNAPTMFSDPTGQEAFSGGFYINGVPASKAWQDVLALGVPTAPGTVTAAASGPTPPAEAGTSGSGGAEAAGSSSGGSSSPSATPDATPTPYSYTDANGVVHTCYPTGNPGELAPCPVAVLPQAAGSQPLPAQAGVVATPTGTVTATPTPTIVIPSGGQYPILP
jgi:RHS repeat-associated protein